MTGSTRPFLPVAAGVITLGLVAWLIYCFHFNFDLTDEGLYLYSVVPHPDFPSANYYFLWFLELNARLNGGLLALRFATLGSIVVASTVVFREYRRLNGEFLPPARAIVGYSLFLLSGLGIYSIGLSSWSYNTVVFLAVALLFAAVVRRMRTASVDAVVAVHVGASVALALSARLSSGVLLVIIGILTLFVPPLRVTVWRRTGLAAVAAAVCAVATYLALSGHPVTRAHLADVLVLAAQSSHAHLLTDYLGNTGRFVLERMLPLGFVWWLARQVFRKHLPELVDRRFHVLYFLGGAVLVLPFDPLGGFLLLLGQMFLVALVMVLRGPAFAQADRQARAVAAIGAGLAFLGSVGTNNNLVEMSVMHALLLVPFALIVFRAVWQRRDAPVVLLAYLAVFAGSVIYHKQYREYYRSPVRGDARYVRASAPYLTGVRIPAEVETLLANVDGALGAQGFSRERDAVLAYADLPGIGAALGLPMFGAPWLFTGYQSIDAFNCHAIRNDAHQYRHVYLLLTSPLAGNLRTCVDERLEAGRGLRSVNAGEFFHYWAGRRVRLTVVGPFQVKPPRVD